MTIARWAARSHVRMRHVSPAYVAANHRLLDGLRLAGMAEG
jgi:hypothetical protein